MKKIFVIALAAIIVLSVPAFAHQLEEMNTSAAHSSIESSEYTNVPGTPTEDAVLEITSIVDAETLPEPVDYTIETLLPSEMTMDVLTDIYNFVLDNQKRPVRYFPEDVQVQVQGILGGETVDIVDILHMTEFMSVLPETCEIEDAYASVDMLFDVDYEIGQLVVVMFGDAGDINPNDISEEDIADIVWTPLPAQVTEPGNIHFVIPAELLREIQGKETLFNVLTVRIGARGSSWRIEKEELIPWEEKIFSKEMADMTKISDSMYGSEGEPLPDDFRIFIIKHSDETLHEIARIKKYMEQNPEIEEDDLPIIRYFNYRNCNEASLLLTDGFDLDKLLAYEIKHIQAENYKDTYGDVLAEFEFPTPYEDGQEIVTILGILKDEFVEETDPEVIVPEESRFEWTIQRTEVKDGLVDITFEQTLLPQVEAKGALMIVLSDSLVEESKQ